MSEPGQVLSEAMRARLTALDRARDIASAGDAERTGRQGESAADVLTDLAAALEPSRNGYGAA